MCMTQARSSLPYGQGSSLLFFIRQCDLKTSTTSIDIEVGHKNIGAACAQQLPKVPSVASLTILVLAPMLVLSQKGEATI